MPRVRRRTKYHPGYTDAHIERLVDDGDFGDEGFARDLDEHGRPNGRGTPAEHEAMAEAWPVLRDAVVERALARGMNPRSTLGWRIFEDGDGEFRPGLILVVEGGRPVGKPGWVRDSEGRWHRNTPRPPG